MLKSSWRVLVALALMLAFSHFSANAAVQQDGHKQSIANSLRDIASTYREQSERSARPGRKDEPCRYGEEKRYSELCAQWKAADAAVQAADAANNANQWARWTTWLGMINALFVVIAVGLNIQANSISGRTARHQLRAYLTAPTVKVEKIHRSRICAIIKNVGETTAHSVKITTIFDADIKINEVSSTIAFGPISPGESRIHHCSVVNDFTTDEPKKGIPCLNIVLEYTDVFEQTWRSSYVYFLHDAGRRKSGEDWLFYLHPKTQQKEEEVKSHNCWFCDFCSLLACEDQGSAGIVVPAQTPVGIDGMVPDQTSPLPVSPTTRSSGAFGGVLQILGAAVGLGAQDEGREGKRNKNA